MSKKGRKNGSPVGPVANPTPRKFLRSITECKHERGQWDVTTQVMNVNFSPSGDQRPNAPDRELVGHMLVVRKITCTDCGEVFRFKNVPVGGNPAVAPVAGKGALELYTAIEPDKRILTPGEAGRPRIIKP